MTGEMVIKKEIHVKGMPFLVHEGSNITKTSTMQLLDLRHCPEMYVHVIPIATVY